MRLPNLLCGLQLLFDSCSVKFKYRRYVEVDFAGVFFSSEIEPKFFCRIRNRKITVVLIFLFWSTRLSSLFFLLFWYVRRLSYYDVTL